MEQRVERQLPASFVVRIFHLENGTWQGQVSDVRSGKTQNFRSALEMIKVVEAQIAQGQAGRQERLG